MAFLHDVSSLKPFWLLSLVPAKYGEANWHLVQQKQGSGAKASRCLKSSMLYAPKRFYFAFSLFLMRPLRQQA